MIADGTIDRAVNASRRAEYQAWEKYGYKFPFAYDL